MPWKVESVVDARRAFINDWLQKRHEGTFEAICELHGISRQVGYKWVARFFDGGLANLVDRSRAPVHRPQTTPEEVVDAIVALRKRFPHYGPRKIRATLQASQPGVQWPAPSTIGDLLKSRGLVTERVTNQTSSVATSRIPSPMYVARVRNARAGAITACCDISTSTIHGALATGCVVATTAPLPGLVYSRNFPG